MNTVDIPRIDHGGWDLYIYLCEVKHASSVLKWTCTAKYIWNEDIKTSEWYYINQINIIMLITFCLENDYCVKRKGCAMSISNTFSCDISIDMHHP